MPTGEAKRRGCPPQPGAAAASFSLSSSGHLSSQWGGSTLPDWKKKKSNVPPPICVQQEQGSGNWVSSLLSLPVEMPESKIMLPVLSPLGKNVHYQTPMKIAGSNCCTVWIPRQKSPPHDCSNVFLDACFQGNFDSASETLQQRHGRRQSEPGYAVQDHGKLQLIGPLLGLVGMAGMRLACPPLHLPLLELLLLSHQHFSSRNASVASSRKGRGGRRTFWRLPLNLALATVGPFCGSLLRRGLTGVLFLLQVKLKENVWERQQRSMDVTDMFPGIPDVYSHDDHHFHAPGQQTPAKFCSAGAPPVEGENVLAIMMHKIHSEENHLVGSRPHSDAPDQQSAIELFFPPADRKAEGVFAIVVHRTPCAKNGRPVVGTVTKDGEDGAHDCLLDLLSRSVIHLEHFAASPLPVSIDLLPKDDEFRFRKRDHAVQKLSFALSLNAFLAAREWGTEQVRTVRRPTLLAAESSTLEPKQLRPSTVEEGLRVSELAGEDMNREMNRPDSPGSRNLAGEGSSKLSWDPTSQLRWRDDAEPHRDLTGDELPQEGQVRTRVRVADAKTGSDLERDDGLMDRVTVGNWIPSPREFAGGIYSEESLSDQSGLILESPIQQAKLCLAGGLELSTGEPEIESQNDSILGGGNPAVEPDGQSSDPGRRLSIPGGKESVEEDSDLSEANECREPTDGDSGVVCGGQESLARSETLTSEPDVTHVAQTGSCEVSPATPQSTAERPGAVESCYPEHPFADHPTCVALRETRHSHGDQTYLGMADLLRAPWNQLVFWHGRCKEGRPTLCIRLGKAVRELPFHELKNFISITISHIEYAELHFYDKVVKQVNLLMDLEGLGFMRLPPMTILSSIGALLNRDYAGRGGWIILVNAPVMLGFVISAIQGVILRPSHTGGVIDSSFRGFLEGKERIMMLGSKYRPALQSHFQENMLPGVLGGACPCNGSSEATCCRLGTEFLRSPSKSCLEGCQLVKSLAVPAPAEKAAEAAPENSSVRHLPSMKNLNLWFSLTAYNPGYLTGYACPYHSRP